MRCIKHTPGLMLTLTHPSFVVPMTPCDLVSGRSYISGVTRSLGRLQGQTGGYEELTSPGRSTS